MQIHLAKKEEMLKVKVEQIELNEAEAQSMQFRVARWPAQVIHPAGTKRPSTWIVIRDEPKDGPRDGPKIKRPRKMILSPSEDEEAEDIEPIGESLKKLKQASASAFPTKPREPPRKAKFVKPSEQQVEVNPPTPTLIKSVVAAVVESLNVFVTTSTPPHTNLTTPNLPPQINQPHQHHN